MKTCPFCAEAIQDRAIVCKHCNRDVATVATSTSGSATATASTRASSGNSSRRSLLLVTVLALVGVLGIQQMQRLDRASSAFAAAAGNVPALIPPRVTGFKDEDAADVGAGHYLTWAWDVTAPQTSCRLTGHVQVLTGGSRDVDVFVATADDLANWKNDHDAKVYYQSGRKTAVTLDVAVNGPGQYVLVVSNAFSLLTSKTVQTKDVKVRCAA